MDYTCDIELGAEYRDEITGWTGHATYVVFDLTGIPHAVLSGMTKDGNEIKTFEFAATRLTRIGDAPGDAGDVLDLRERTAELAGAGRGGAKASRP